MRQMEKVKVAIRPLIKWDEAYRAALATQGIDSKGKFPPMDWRIRSLMAEHSQVTLVELHLSLKHLMQFVGVHLIRHPYLLPFIHSQRIDRDQKEEIERITQKRLNALLRSSWLYSKKTSRTTQISIQDGCCLKAHRTTMISTSTHRLS